MMSSKCYLVTMKCFAILVKTFARTTAIKTTQKIRNWKMFFPQTRRLMTE